MRKRLSEQYIAGFFDGEGSVGIYHANKTVPFPRTQVTQNAGGQFEAVVNELIGRYGGNASVQISASGRPKFNWQLSNKKAAKFLESISEHLVLKHEQALIAVGWHNLRPKAERNDRGWLVRNDWFLDEPAIRILKALKASDLKTITSRSPDLKTAADILQWSGGADNA